MAPRNRLAWRIGVLWCAAAGLSAPVACAAAGPATRTATASAPRAYPPPELVAATQKAAAEMATRLDKDFHPR